MQKAPGKSDCPGKSSSRGPSRPTPLKLRRGLPKKKLGKNLVQSNEYGKAAQTGAEKQKGGAPKKTSAPNQKTCNWGRNLKQGVTGRSAGTFRVA